MQLTLRNGAQIEVDVEDFETSKLPIDGRLTRLSWTAPSDWTRKLHYVDIEEVVAIVAIQPFNDDIRP